MKKCVLAGGGHAHLHVLKRLQSESIKDIQFVLISPDRYQYHSDMFSGFAEGIYTESDIRIDLKKLAEKAGAEWKGDAVSAIDAEQKKLLTAAGDVINYEAVSFDIGSLTAGTGLAGVKEYAHRIKPNYHFPKVIESVKRVERLVIAGDGAAGIEMALSLQTSRHQQGIEDPVKLVMDGQPLPSANKKIQDKVKKIIEDRHINLVTDSEVKEVRKGKILTQNGGLPFDELLWLTGAQAPGLFKTSRLPVDDAGYLLVEDTLQVKAFPSIFGAGDCASLSDYPELEKAGIQQGPVLFENLKGFLTSGDGVRFKPKSRYLQILSISGKRGLLLYRNQSLEGRWVWRLKNKIDKDHISYYRN